MDTAQVATMCNEITDALTSQPIKITIGQGAGQKLFSVHKKLFEIKAPIFIVMLGGGLQEEMKTTLDLPDASREAFEVFSEWLYWDTLTSLSDVRLVASALRLKIFKTVIFADRYSLVKLHDRAVSILVHNHPGIISLHNLKPITAYVVRNAAPDCTIRPSLARMWAWYIKEYRDRGVNMRNHPDFGPFIHEPDFATEVFNYGGDEDETPFADNEPCNFHIHRELATCPYEDFDGLNGTSPIMAKTPSNVVGMKNLVSKPAKTFDDTRRMRSLVSSRAKNMKSNQREE